MLWPPLLLPARVGVWSPPNRIPKHTHSRSPNAATCLTLAPHSQGLLPHNKNGHLASCQTHFRKIMRKPWLWDSGSILPPARSLEFYRQKRPNPAPHSSRTSCGRGDTGLSKTPLTISPRLWRFGVTLPSKISPQLCPKRNQVGQVKN